MLSGKTFHGIVYGIEILVVCMENFIDQDKIILENCCSSFNFCYIDAFFSCATVFNERR